MNSVEAARKMTAMVMWSWLKGTATCTWGSLKQLHGPTGIRLLHATMNSTIKSLALGSPFSQLWRLIFEVVKQQTAVQSFGHQIATLAQFNINGLDALIIHGALAVEEPTVEEIGPVYSPRETIEEFDTIDIPEFPDMKRRKRGRNPYPIAKPSLR